MAGSSIPLATVLHDERVWCPKCDGPTVMTVTSYERAMGEWNVIVGAICPRDGTTFEIKTSAEGTAIVMEAYYT